MKDESSSGEGSHEFKEVIGRRRSIRFYQPWRPVEREKIQIILEAARLCSRAVNADFAKAIVLYRDCLAQEDLDALKTPTSCAVSPGQGLQEVATCYPCA